MQMPGSYLTDEFVMRVLGPGSGGELAWDILNGVFVMLAALWIAGKERPSAAIVAASLAYLWHLKDGAWNLGERDWTVTMLLLLSIACLFQFLRSNRPVWMGPAFFCAGLAATIKPPALMVTVACALLVLWNSRRTSSSVRRVVLWSTLGLLVPLAVVAIYLFRFQAFHEFLASATQLTSYYASLQRVSFINLLRGIRLPIQLGILAFVFFLLNRSWRSTESLVLLVAILCAGAMYLMQGKGFSYHIYPVVAFLFIWLVLELEKSSKVNWPRALASGCVLAILIVRLSLYSIAAEQTAVYPMGTLDSLQQDLTTLNVPDLSGHIQCLDMTLGSCLNVLYRMKLVQSTGYLSDFYLFPSKPTSLTESYQRQFYQLVSANPPKIFILSSHTWPGDTESYAQLSNFPVLQQYLDRDYVVVKDYPLKTRAVYRVIGSTATSRCTAQVCGTRIQ